MAGQGNPAIMQSVSTSTADWAGIYAEHGKAMRAAARAEMGGGHKVVLGKVADEVVGDVIEELMTKGADLTQVSNVRGYLTASVRNRVRDLDRRSRFEAPYDLDAEAIVGDQDIEAAVDREELAGQAVAGLDQLPERERYALEERVMKCRPATEVAADLGVAPQRVSQLYNAALRKLRQLPAFTELLSFDPAPPIPSTARSPNATGTPS